LSRTMRLRSLFLQGLQNIPSENVAQKFLNIFTIDKVVKACKRCQ